MTAYVVRRSGLASRLELCSDPRSGYYQWWLAGHYRWCSHTSRYVPRERRVYRPCRSLDDAIYVVACTHHRSVELVP